MLWHVLTSNAPTQQQKKTLIKQIIIQYLYTIGSSAAISLPLWYCSTPPLFFTWKTGNTHSPSPKIPTISTMTKKKKHFTTISITQTSTNHNPPKTSIQRLNSNTPPLGTSGILLISVTCTNSDCAPGCVSDGSNPPVRYSKEIIASEGVERSKSSESLQLQKSSLFFMAGQPTPPPGHVTSPEKAGLMIRAY